MITRKPTISTANPRQLRALQQGRDYAFDCVTPDDWAVTHRASGRSYRVDLRTGSCTCPDHQKRGLPCKHFEMINLGLLLEELKAIDAEKAAAPRRSEAERARRIYNDFGPDC